MDGLDKMLNNSEFFESNFNGANFTPSQKKAIVNAMTNLKEQKGITPIVGGSPTPEAIKVLIQRSIGEVNLTVVRDGVNINEALPFILFGANDRPSDYQSSLKGLVPAGIDVAVSKNAAGDVVFTYTNEDDESDTVTVKNLGNLNYTSFLQSMQNNYFKTNYCLLSLSDETYNVQQFSQPLLFGVLSALGLTAGNQLILRSRTNSWQFRKDRVEVWMEEQKIVPDFSFASKIIPVSGFEIGFDFFMNDRKNLNKL